MISLVNNILDHIDMGLKSSAASKVGTKREPTSAEPLDSAEGIVAKTMPGNLRARRYTSVDFPVPGLPVMRSYLVGVDLMTSSTVLSTSGRSAMSGSTTTLSVPSKIASIQLSRPLSCQHA